MSRVLSFVAANPPGFVVLPHCSGDDWAGQEPAACVPWGAGQTCSTAAGGGGGGGEGLWFAGHVNFEVAVAEWQRGSLGGPAVLFGGGPPLRVLLSGAGHGVLTGHG